AAAHSRSPRCSGCAGARPTATTAAPPTSPPASPRAPRIRRTVWCRRSTGARGRTSWPTCSRCNSPRSDGSRPERRISGPFVHSGGNGLAGGDGFQRLLHARAQAGFGKTPAEDFHRYVFRWIGRRAVILRDQQLDFKITVVRRETTATRGP